MDQKYIIIVIEQVAGIYLLLRKLMRKVMRNLRRNLANEEETQQEGEEDVEDGINQTGIFITLMKLNVFRKMLI